MSTLLYKNKRLLILTITLFVVNGIISYTSLSKQEDPEVQARFATVHITFVSSSVYDAESKIAKYFEKKLFEISHIDSLQLSIQQDVIFILVKLKDRVSNTNQAWSEVRDKLGEIQRELSQDIIAVEFNLERARSHSLLLSLVLKQRNHHLLLEKMTEKLADEVRNVFGTQKVKEYGINPTQIIVDVSPQELLALGLTFADVAHQILNYDEKYSIGFISNDSQRLNIFLENVLPSWQSLQQVPIKGLSGRIVLLEDIATIQRSIPEPLEIFLVSGCDASLLAIHVEPGISVNKWRKRVATKLSSFRAQMPDGLELKIIFDQNEHIQNMFSGLQNSLYTTFILVVVVLFCFMGKVIALLLGFVLALNVLFIFFVMKIAHLELHQISLVALIISLGLIIDNAIIIADALKQKIDDCVPPLKAIQNTIKDLATPLTSSTLTTVLAFCPIILVPGANGEFGHPLGWTVIISLCSSLTISLSITPVLIALFYTPSKDNLESNSVVSIVKEVHRYCLQVCLSNPAVVVTFTILFGVAGFLYLPKTAGSFFAWADRSEFLVQLELSPNTSIYETRKIASDIQKLLEQKTDIEVSWLIGSDLPSFFYNMLPIKRHLPFYAQGIGIIKTDEDPLKVAQELQQILGRKCAKAKILVLPLKQGPTSVPVELRLYHSDLDVLREWGNQVQLLLSQTPGVIQSSSELSIRATTLKLVSDSHERFANSIQAKKIKDQTHAATTGIFSGFYNENNHNIEIRVRAEKRYRKDLDFFYELPLTHQQAAKSQIPIDSVGELHLNSRIRTLYRYNRRRCNIIRGYAFPGVLANEIKSDFLQKFHQLEKSLPKGLNYELAGESEEAIKVQQDLGAFAIILFFLMVMVIVLTFRSFRLAFLIALVALLTVGMAIYNLYLFNYTLDFMALLGLMSLVGIAVNDSIVVLTDIQKDIDSRDLCPNLIGASVFSSSRHVFTTTFTTCFGFLPLLWGGNLWPSVAIVMSTGVLGATFLALYFVPCFFLTVTD